MRDSKGRFIKGHKVLDEWKEISAKVNKERMKGKHYTLGMPPWNKGLRGYMAMEKHYNWQGGRIIDKYGYVSIKIPTHPFANHLGYVKEHRLIVEKQIGRYLKAEEHCHHIDKNKANNNPQNLMAFISNSAHIRFEKKPDIVKPHEIIFDGRKFHH